LRELSASFLQADNYLTPDAETQGLFVHQFKKLDEKLFGVNCRRACSQSSSVIFVEYYSTLLVVAKKE